MGFAFETGGNQMNPLAPLWDAKEVAAYLKTSLKWVYLHASKGTLPCCHVGGLRRFEPDAIRAWARGEPIASVVQLRSIGQEG
jgi:excisionase family DNA binding protein